MDNEFENPKPRFIVPGEMVNISEYHTLSKGSEPSVSASEKVIRLGPGLIQQKDSIQSVNAGILHYQPKDNRFYVEFSSKRYVPYAGDSVIGVVIKRMGEGFVVDIGSAVSCNLSAYAFEGTTKKTKPNLKIGTLVYGKITLAHKDMEPEMECYNNLTNKSEGFGELKQGLVFNCSLGLSRKLLTSKTSVLTLLGATTAFEMAIGLNGAIWVNSSKPTTTIAIRTAILNSEFITDHEELQSMVDEVLNAAM